MKAGARLTPLLPNDVLDRLERLRVRVRGRFTNKRRGEHLTGRGGGSIEFSDYRDYAVGDDLRFVDWNIFARLNRPYLKLYRQEEEMEVALLVDASSSMLFEGKLWRAKELAAAFAVMALFGAEKVSVWVLGTAAGDRRRFLGPCGGRASMRRVFRFLEGVEGGGEEPVERGMEAFAARCTGRGAAVVLSDFLTAGDLGRAFNLLFGAGMEILAVQILAPAELAPELGGDVRLTDAETGRELDVSATAELLGVYHECRRDHERMLRSLCRQRGGRFLRVSADYPLRRLLFEDLRRRGWIG